MTKIVISALYAHDHLPNTKNSKDDQAFQQDEDYINTIREGFKHAAVAELVTSVKMCIARRELDHLMLITDSYPDEAQAEAYSQLLKEMGGCIKIEQVRAQQSNMLGIAKALVESIDSLDDPTDITVHLPIMKNQKTIGLIYGAYARFHSIGEIICIDSKSKTPLRLPILKFNLTKNQRKILEYFLQKKNLPKEHQLDTGKPHYKNIGISSSTYDDNFKRCLKEGFLESKNNKEKITGIGEISLLSK